MAERGRLADDTDVRHIPLILGVTASGKSALGVALARAVGGEVLAADAFQVYRGMDIGTAKPTPEERAGVPHHLIDLAEPTERFSVHQWLRLAEGEIARVRARGRAPIVVGGTNLYAKALLDGLFEGPEPDEALRAELRRQSQAERRAELERVDPAAALRIDRQDERRTIRALEVFRQTGTPISALQAQWDSGAGRDDVAIIIVDRPVEELNRRINARVRAMFERGLEAEARALWATGRLGPQAREALGYKQLIGHFEGRCTLDEAVERIKIETRRFGKQQRTWLRRIRVSARAPILTLDAGSAGVEELAGRAAAWLRAGAVS